MLIYNINLVITATTLNNILHSVGIIQKEEKLKKEKKEQAGAGSKPESSGAHGTHSPVTRMTTGLHCAREPGTPGL